MIKKNESLSTSSDVWLWRVSHVLRTRMTSAHVTPVRGARRPRGAHSPHDTACAYVCCSHDDDVWQRSRWFGLWRARGSSHYAPRSRQCGGWRRDTQGEFTNCTTTLASWYTACGGTEEFKQRYLSLRALPVHGTGACSNVRWAASYQIATGRKVPREQPDTRGERGWEMDAEPTSSKSWKSWRFKKRPSSKKTAFGI